jgi:hypothetical protein
MASISHVFTAARVAKILGVDEDLIWELSDGLDPEDGRLWILDDTEDGPEDGLLGFTEHGIETLRYCLDEHYDAQKARAKE